MITIDDARRVIAAGEARANEIGVPVNITVLDAGAHLKAFSRMDGAVLGSIDLAMGKARTAVLFQTTSEAVWEYCKPGAPAHGLELSNGGLTPFAGGMGEAGPVWEIPIELVRKNYEVNVFLPLVLTQGVVQRWVREGKRGKVVFTSSMGGLFTPANWGTYVSTKHALESIAEALQQELAPYGIKIQTINPGAYYTGYNETMADNPFRWLDDSKNFTKRADLRKGFDDFFATPEGKMDPKEMIDRMIEVVPADIGRFRNVVPKVIEDMLKEHQLRAWENQI
ncbi:short-chain dehydrogenase/reductase SDR family domain-containig protein [Rhizobium sp. Kim5]|uniref:SDR family oxidoreductase n=1 Tax=Rhizobium sp. Kim5 TaxID=2020311 RepID=UPI000A2A2555|nr:SDR family oxidoreductase [Rhizobium sp. Kim5]ARQ58213.1 short-chain dehydrogenase/reductase SDR family domain-containig protein [Rhizobium sp. Kim5]